MKPSHVVIEPLGSLRCSCGRELRPHEEPDFDGTLYQCPRHRSARVVRRSMFDPAEARGGTQGSGGRGAAPPGLGALAAEPEWKPDAEMRDLASTLAKRIVPGAGMMLVRSTLRRLASLDRGSVVDLALVIRDALPGRADVLARVLRRPPQERQA